MPAPSPYRALQTTGLAGSHDYVVDTGFDNPNKNATNVALVNILSQLSNSVLDSLDSFFLT